MNVQRSTFKDGPESNALVVDPLNDPEWDSRLKHFPDASVFHSSHWLNALNRSYGHQFLAAFPSEDTHRGGLVLSRLQSPLKGRRLISLPFSDFAPVLGHDEETTACLMKWAIAETRTFGGRYMEIRGGELSVPNARPCLQFHGHELDLTVGKPALWDGLTSANQRAIRKAQRAGLQIRYCHDTGAMDAYYRLHRLTRSKHGLPPQPRKFFQHIQDELLVKGHGFVALAGHPEEKQPLAGALFLTHGSTSVFKFGGTRTEALPMRPNNFLMWETIRHLAGQGMERLHLGRTDLHNEGLRRFKNAWGGRENFINYYRYDVKHDTFRALIRPVSPRLEAFGRCLTPRLSAAVGRLLYPMID